MNAKCRLLALREMFIKYTDSEHYISINKIKGYLESNGYMAHATTIKSDIEALMLSGMDIEYVHNKGYHLRSRLFSICVLKMLVDIIVALHFLTVEESETIIRCLENLCSIYEAPLLQRNTFMQKRIKSDNEQFFESIDVINSALSKNRQISFCYYDYDADKHLVKRGEKERTCSPFALIIKDKHYYVIAYYAKYPDNYTNFRLDRMKNVKLLSKKRCISCERVKFESYINSSFSMFDGKSEYVTLKFPLENKYCNIVVDRFGKSVIMFKNLESNSFTIHVPVKVDFPQLFFSWIFSFDGEVEILSPIKLKREYSDMLMRNLVHSYE